MNKNAIRKGNPADIPALLDLYRVVAASGGLAYGKSEITESYISGVVHKSLAQGILLVISSPHYPQQLIGEIHGYPIGLQTFSHVFENVTMAVHPEFQGRGLGSLLVQTLQTEIEQYWPHILKVELMCFSNNEPALRLYQKLGFEIEGRRKNRVRLNETTFADGLALGWTNPNYEPEGA